MKDNVFLTLAVGLISMVLCSAVHEWAHAFTAWKLGDDTAAREGRLTLNPLAHIDPVGTLLLPAIMLVTSGGILGWAKPVPYNPGNLTRRFRVKTSELMIAAAGPVANLVMAFVCAALLVVQLRFDLLPLTVAEPIAILLNFMVFLNVVLCLFNLIPLPPLDGSKVIMGILPDHMGRAYASWLHQYQQYSMMILIVIVIMFGSVLIKATSAIITAIYSVLGVF